MVAKTSELATDSRDAPLSEPQKDRFREAVVELSGRTIDTAVILGKSKIQGMNRDVAAIQLKMLNEALIRGPAREPGVTRAIDWLNIHIRQLNAVRSALGQQHVLVRTKI